MATQLTLCETEEQLQEALDDLHSGVHNERHHQIVTRKCWACDGAGMLPKWQAQATIEFLAELETIYPLPNVGDEVVEATSRDECHHDSPECPPERYA